jgi:hypothetical protein
MSELGVFLIFFMSPFLLLPWLARINRKCKFIAVLIGVFLTLFHSLVPIVGMFYELIVTLILIPMMAFFKILPIGMTDDIFIFFLGVVMITPTLAYFLLTLHIIYKIRSHKVD